MLTLLMLDSNQGQSNEIKLSIAQQHRQEEISSPSPGFITIFFFSISSLNTISVALIYVCAETKCYRKIDNVDKVHALLIL